MAIGGNGPAFVVPDRCQGGHDIRRPAARCGWMRRRRGRRSRWRRSTMPAYTTGPTTRRSIPSGRLWFGTMDNGESAGDAARCTGSTAHGDHRRVGGECVITNGPAVSADGRLALPCRYRRAGTIWRFDIAANDRLVERRGLRRGSRPKTAIPTARDARFGRTACGSGCGAAGQATPLRARWDADRRRSRCRAPT